MYRICIMSLKNFDSLPLLTDAPNGLAPVYVLIPQSGNLVVTWLLRMRRGVPHICHACPRWSNAVPRWCPAGFPSPAACVQICPTTYIVF